MAIAGASVDVQFSPKTIEADGLLQVVDSVGDPVGLLHSSSPKKTVITQAIPSTAASAFVLTIDNVQLLEDKFKKWVLYHNLATLSTDLSALSGVDELGSATQPRNRFDLSPADEALPKRTLSRKVNKKNTVRWVITKPPSPRVDTCR